MRKSCIIGGVVPVVFVNIHFPDILKTVVLASIGALVSTLISILIKKWMDRNRKAS